MIYSVWNQSARLFDYYEAPGSEATANVEKPAHLRHRTLGSTPDQAAWPLPGGSKLIGQGEYARGRIASTGGSSLGLFEDGDMLWMKLGLLGLSAFLVWRYLK